MYKVFEVLKTVLFVAVLAVLSTGTAQAQSSAGDKWSHWCSWMSPLYIHGEDLSLNCQNWSVDDPYGAQGRCMTSSTIEKWKVEVACNGQMCALKGVARCFNFNTKQASWHSWGFNCAADAGGELPLVDADERGGSCTYGPDSQLASHGVQCNDLGQLVSWTWMQ